MGWRKLSGSSLRQKELGGFLAERRKVGDSKLRHREIVGHKRRRLTELQVVRRGLMIEPGGTSLGPKSDPAGLMPDLNSGCWAYAGRSLILKGYIAGFDAGLQR